MEERLEKTARLLASANANYDNYFSQLNRTEAHIVQTRHRVQMVTARYKEHQRRFGLRLAARQRHGEPQLLSVILGSTSLADLSRRATFMRVLSEHDAQLQRDLKADRIELTQAQNALEAQWKERETLARAAHDERARIARGQRQQQTDWQQINASKSALLQLAAARQRASDDIGAQIQNLEARKDQIAAAYEAQAARERAAQRAAERAAYAQRQARYAAPRSTRRYSGTQRITRYVGRNSRDNSGDGGGETNAPMNYAERIEVGPRYAPRVDVGQDGWVPPTRGRISSRFGNRYHPILHREKMHTGEDIAAGYGTPFRAARGGRVLYSGWQTAYGNTIIVDNGNGTTTLYGHASKLNVRAGQAVRAGQTIGNVGSTGWSTGPHLHFEVRKNGVPVDPSKYVH